MELIDTGESLREKASAVQAQLLADEMNCDEDEVEGNAGVAIGGDASTKRRRRLQRNVTELLNESEKVYNEVNDCESLEYLLVVFFLSFMRVSVPAYLKLYQN